MAKKRNRKTMQKRTRESGKEFLKKPVVKCHRHVAKIISTASYRLTYMAGMPTAQFEKVERLAEETPPEM